MSKFIKWSSFKQVYNTLYSRFVYLPRRQKEITAKTKHYDLKMIEDPDYKLPIIKSIVEGFEDQSCLARWGEVSDREIGGDSEASLLYNSILGEAIFKGHIRTDDKDRLQASPSIGMIQRLPFQIQLGIFNCLRVQLIGDGHPIVCEISISTWGMGVKTANAFILSSKDQKLITYELPLRNFQILKSQLIQFFKDGVRQKQAISKIIDQEPNSQRHLKMASISFRIVSTEAMQRQVRFKKIQLVYSKRGEPTNLPHYRNPYFYIVDDDVEQDEIFETVNLGPYTVSQNR